MHGVCAQNVNRKKQKMENKIKQILAIAENAVDLPCLNVTFLQKHLILHKEYAKIVV